MRKILELLFAGVIGFFLAGLQSPFVAQPRIYWGVADELPYFGVRSLAVKISRGAYPSEAASIGEVAPLPLLLENRGRKDARNVTIYFTSPVEIESFPPSFVPTHSPNDPSIVLLQIIPAGFSGAINVASADAELEIKNLLVEGGSVQKVPVQAPHLKIDPTLASIVSLRVAGIIAAIGAALGLGGVLQYRRAIKLARSSSPPPSNVETKVING